MMINQIPEPAESRMLEAVNAVQEFPDCYVMTQRQGETLMAMIESERLMEQGLTVMP